MQEMMGALVRLQRVEHGGASFLTRSPTRSLLWERSFFLMRKTQDSQAGYQNASFQAVDSDQIAWGVYTGHSDGTVSGIL
jgi:hypothetical protein